MRDHEQLVVAAGLAIFAGAIFLHAFMLSQEIHEKNYLYNIDCSRNWNYSLNGVYMGAILMRFNLYVKLMEECGEVVQACSKVLKRGRHGVEEVNLSEEVGDVLGVIRLLQSKDALDPVVVGEKLKQTYEKYEDLEL